MTLQARLDEMLAVARPMSEAPRDGTEILAWSRDGQTWHQVQWVMPHRDRAWTKPTCPPDYGYWGMRWMPEYNQADGQFECWCPIPPHPAVFAALVEVAKATSLHRAADSGEDKVRLGQQLDAALTALESALEAGNG